MAGWLAQGLFRIAGELPRKLLTSAPAPDKLISLLGSLDIVKRHNVGLGVPLPEITSRDRREK
jgi:hypothetical protein